MFQSSLSYLDDDVIREINVLVYTISLIKSSIFIAVIRELKKFYVYGYVGGPTPYKFGYCISMEYFFILYYKCNSFVTPREYVLCVGKHKMVNS